MDRHTLSAPRVIANVEFDLYVRRLIGPGLDYRFACRTDTPDAEQVVFVFPTGQPDRAAAFVAWSADYLDETRCELIEGARRGLIAAKLVFA